MARLTIEKVRRSDRNAKLNGGTVRQQKKATLKSLEREYARTGEIWIKTILNKVSRCTNAHRCNCKYCPTCSNPRASRAKRRKGSAAYRMPYVSTTTPGRKTGEYRVDAGQRMVSAFDGLPLVMTHCATVNLLLVPLNGNLEQEVEIQRRRLRRVFKKLGFGAIARGKFDIALKYADELAFELPDNDLPSGITNANLPHQRFAMLHIHFVVFDPWMSRSEVRDLFAKAYPGVKRICFKQTKAHTVLGDGTMLGSAQGYMEYLSMEKVEVPFGDDADQAVIEFARIDSTWTRRNRNFSFGKPITESGIEIDHDRVAHLERENRLAWIKRNWTKLCFAEQFIHLWFSSLCDMIAGIKPMPNYRQQFKGRFSLVFTQYCNWLRGEFFEAIDFRGFLDAALSFLAGKPPDPRPEA